MRIRRVVATARTPPPRGFPRWAWWTVLLSIFLFLVPLTSPWWSTVLRAEISESADGADDDPASTPAPGPVEEPLVPGSTLKLTLFLPRAQGEGLRSVVREVPYVRGFLQQIEAAVGELAVSLPEAPALLPPGTRVLASAYVPTGTVYVDLSPELDAARGLGSAEETMLIQGIVSTIMENFSAVRRVTILVDGKTPKPAHLDLSRPFRIDDPLFRLEDEPLPGASPVPPAAPLPVATPAAPTSAPALPDPPPEDQETRP